MNHDLTKDALDYHSANPPGKLAITATKPMATQRDLALAYSPGVAVPCEKIAKDPSLAAKYTAKGNLVGVISNGTAVLGLGAIGALASKPVMEGKAVLFKKFSGVDVFDLEVNETNPAKFIEIVASLEPTFGGINLEDIKAPECFEIEKALCERMNIPVFHDDQHGTAIVAAAAINSALKVANKKIEDVKLVVSGAGAAAQACTDLLLSMGLLKDKLLMIDSRGVIYQGREKIDKYKQRFATSSGARTMDDAIVDADIFLGCSGPNSLTAAQVAKMSSMPIVLAMANPVPEIMPEEAIKGNSDVIMATGRSDYPNQVNNVLCFPFIFRGALDVGAKTINESMKVACVEALTKLAMTPPPANVRSAYASESLKFGATYLIPKPFDPRLIIEIASAVAKAAMDSGVAERPIEDLEAYRQTLSEYVFKSSSVMQPLMEQARKKQVRLCYSDAEDSRVLQAAQQVIEQQIAFPVLVGNKSNIESKLVKLDLSMTPGKDCEIIDPGNADAIAQNAEDYLAIMNRKGITKKRARHIVSTRNSVMSSLMLKRGQVDALLCGATGPFRQRLRTVAQVIGKREGVLSFYTLVGVITPSGIQFVCDTHVCAEPTAEQLANMAELAAHVALNFGVTPKIAMVSHSNFGTGEDASSKKMAAAAKLAQSNMPDFQVDGEMTVEAALSPSFREDVCTDSCIEGKANILVMPNRDAAHIAYNILKVSTESPAPIIGPILLGTNLPVNIVTESATARSLVNMSAVAAVAAQLAMK